MVDLHHTSADLPVVVTTTGPQADTTTAPDSVALVDTGVATSVATVAAITLEAEAGTMVELAAATTMVTSGIDECEGS